MKKTLSCTLAGITILLVLSATINTAPAADYTKVGVRIGDYAVYKTSVSGSTVNKTVMLVYGIVGTQVYLNFTYYYPNNTIQSKSQVITDTVTGGGLSWLWLIAGDLTAGDPTYSGSAYKINETKSMDIGGATRTVNHLNGTSWVFPVEAYWDKGLGIMVKMNVWLIFWLNYTMISFTSPSAPSGALSTMTMIALAEGVVIAMLLAYVVVSKRGGKGKK